MSWQEPAVIYKIAANIIRLFIEKPESGGI